MSVVLPNGVEVQVPTGRPILTQITFEECSNKPVGRFGEEKVTKYRVLSPGYWELYVETKEGADTGYVLEAAGESSLSEIPVAVVYGRKTGTMMSKPPLLDLALINLAHFQKYSDYSEGLRMCIPQLCFKGLDPTRKIEVIGHHTFHVVSPSGDVWFAEPTGAGLNPQRLPLMALAPSRLTKARPLAKFNKTSISKTYSAKLGAIHSLQASVCFCGKR